MGGTYRQAWAQARAKHYGEIMTNAMAKAMVYLGDRAIAELAAQIEQLRAELDGYQGRTVLHCVDRDLDRACMASLDEPDGTILRATDTGRELVLADRTWLPR